MDLGPIKSNRNKPNNMLTSLQLESPGTLSCAHQALVSLWEQTARDVLALQLLAVTQGV